MGTRYNKKNSATARIEVKYNAGIKSMIDLRRRGEGVVKVIEHGRTRLETQSTRAKAAAIAPAAKARR